MPFFTKVMWKLVSAVFLFTLFSCKEKAFELQGETQGTTYYIKYFSDKSLVEKAEIDSILHQFDMSLSTYIPNSIISKINRDEAVEVDDFFVENFKISQKVYHDTDGLFDPTIGVLVNAYGFGPSKQSIEWKENSLDSLLQLVGFDKIRLNEKRIAKKHQAMYFDFNAVAQGYAVDVLVAHLKSKGIKNALVEIGGEIFTFGQNLETKKPWTTGIDDPLQNPEHGRKLIAKLSQTDLGLATSGNYRKIKTDSVTGQRFVHIIHPKTGLATKTSILSATILAKTTAEADAYATATMLMEPKQLMEFYNQRPQLLAFVVYEENGKIKIFESEGLKAIKLP